MNTPDSISQENKNIIIKNWDNLEESQKKLLIKIWNVLTSFTY